MIAPASRRTALTGIALLIALIAGFFVAPAAHAVAMQSGPFTLQIHKYEQPATPGDPATGLPIDPAVIGTDPVPGAAFTATRVPGIDVTTNAGQRDAANLTVAQAVQRIHDQGTPPTATSGLTNAQGNASLTVPNAGLFYVEETTVPTGFIRSAPFLVVLPLTNPDTRDGWLSTVHIYPKNARSTADIELNVFDRDAVMLGDIVRWQSSSGIPHQLGSDGYVVQNILADHVVLEGSLSDIQVRLTGGPPLVAGVHYNINQIEVDGRWGFETVFTDAGRALLEANPGSRVTIDYDTRVVAEYNGNVKRGGSFTNLARLIVGNTRPDRAPSDTATTKWGSLEIIVHLKGDPSHLIKGAKVKVYLTKEDAAADRNPLYVDGKDLWITDGEGRVRIDGLRLSNHVDGREIPEDHPDFRWFYVSLVGVPKGYSADGITIKRVSVTSVSHAQLAEFEVVRGNTPTPTPTPPGRLQGLARGPALIPICPSPAVRSPGSPCSPRCSWRQVSRSS